MMTFQPVPVLAASVTLTLALLLGDLIFLDDLNLFFKEGHGVERLTVILFAAAILLWFVKQGLRRGLGGWHVPAALLLMAARELDFDKRLTDQGLLKLRTYTSPGGWEDKLVGALVLLLILVVLVRFLRRNLSDWLSRLPRLEPGALWVFVGLALVTIAKTIDGLDRKLAPFGIDVPREIGLRAGRIEEVLELAFALCLIQAIAHLRRTA
ncbi:hypothetical protein C8J28_11512 [Cereibacter azotoformans]|uniref:Transmembrane protein n=2 Tax=Cereibacter azotoformans TaxID=43057 RepID=A0A2T5JXH4_9RHOB|nr:hypothetical protein [Cereibacter azotoformans]PTR14869.1 hypothetical protein C8J28_11512 [Cereibacter azotoformans]